MIAGIRFETQPPVVPEAPNRADVACFVGFVRRRRRAPLPAELERWLREQGWTTPPYGRSRRRVAALLDLPVPCETWDAFDRLFEWERRPLDRRGGVGSSYLGAAVRSFFAQGGRKCYVVRVGDPWRYDVSAGWRRRRLRRLVPGHPYGLAASPADRRSWSGVAHLFGLPEVSFLCLPDLPDAARTAPVRLAIPQPPPPPEERFAECSAGGEGDLPDQAAPPPVRAPRADLSGFRAWAELLHDAALLVSRFTREVQVLAALPLLPEDVELAVGGRRMVPSDEVLRFLIAAGWLDRGLAGGADGLASAFVQLAHPWLRTPGAGRLPEGLEPPDGALAGVLARNALLRGTFRSAAGLPAGDVVDVYPGVDRDQMEGADEAALALPDRVCLFGPTPSGHRLLSDVTTSPDEAWRPGGVSRLAAAILRAARRLGEESVFEPSGPGTWLRVEERLTDLMLHLLRLGALRGRTPEEAFDVRCDRTTMTQNDLDSGRLVARVSFAPAASIERVTVTLAMDEGGRVSLAQREAA